MMRTRKRFGQHFLERVWADKVIDAIAPRPDDAFLEIGPGPGILTLKLAPKVSKLVGIEIDRDLAQALEPKLPPHASIATGDVREIDIERVLLAAGITGPLRIAGNLPYNISSPILVRLIELQSRRPVIDATLMLQREVADRIAARPGSREYGVLSVLTQWRADVTMLLAIPPGAFRPPPEVRSALIRLSFRPPPFCLKDQAIFDRMVRAMFTQRRKMLGNALSGFAEQRGWAASDALARAGIDSRRRPETLQLTELARLAEVFGSS